MLVYLCTEKIVDRVDRITRIRIGISKGVLIHFQFPERFFSNKNAVRAIKVTRCMVLIAQPWTEALARGVKISRAYIA